MAETKKAKRTGKPVQVYLPPDLWDRLHAERQRTRRSLTTEIVEALEKHLPPAPKSSPGKGKKIPEKSPVVS